MNFQPSKINQATPRAAWAALAVFMLSLSITAPAIAGGLGYIDDRRLIEQSPQGRAILKELAGEFAERARELKGRFDRFQARQQDLEKNSVLMKPEELRNKADDLQELQRQLQRAQREYNEDYARRRTQRLSRLNKVITDVIIAVAKREKIDIVFQRAVYANPDIDMTARVLDELKKQYEK